MDVLERLDLMIQKAKLYKNCTEIIFGQKVENLAICVTHRMHTDRVRVPLSSRNKEKQGSERLTTVSVTSKCAISKKLEAS